MGRSKTPKKSAASKRNGALGGRPPVPLEQIECTCGTADGVHAFKCKRRQTEYRRNYLASKKTTG